MKRLLFLLILFFGIVCFNGCDVIRTLDQDEILFNKTSYRVIADQYWEMNEPEIYHMSEIDSNGTSLRIRHYDSDKTGEFIYCENNGLLYHNSLSNFPENTVDNIDHIVFRSIKTAEDTVCSDPNVISEYLGLLTEQTVSDIKVSENICSVSVFYRNYPANCFSCNIVTDESGDHWLRLNNKNGFVKLDSNSNLFIALSYERIQ